MNSEIGTVLTGQKIGISYTNHRPLHPEQVGGARPGIRRRREPGRSLLNGLSLISLRYRISNCLNR
jgi:hypothetical protein